MTKFHFGNQHLECVSCHFTVTIKLIIKQAISRDLKCQYIRESNTHAINVTIKLVFKVTSKDIRSLYMKESSTHAINVIQNSVSRVPSRDILCLYVKELQFFLVN